MEVPGVVLGTKALVFIKAIIRWPDLVSVREFQVYMRRPDVWPLIFEHARDSITTTPATIKCVLHLHKPLMLCCSYIAIGQIEDFRKMFQSAFPIYISSKLFVIAPEDIASNSFHTR